LLLLKLLYLGQANTRMTTMTTLLKIEANRDNALASTGPRTAEGRAIVSGNAIRHGLLSWKPVIPGLENAEDWETHLDRTLDSLAPVGYAETLLAERAALLLWRLGRVARYERETTSIALENTEARKQPKLEEAEQSVAEAQAVVTLTEGLRTLPLETELDGAAAARLLEKAAEATELDIYEMRGWPSYVNDNTLEDLDWTAARLLEYVQIVAKKAKRDSDDLLSQVADDARDTLEHAQEKREKLLAAHDRERRSMLLPDTLTLEKLSRYETTLERSLYKALHELERWRAARDGQTVPPPVAVDVNLSGPAQE
jgi:hypothetical protein